MATVALGVVGAIIGGVVTGGDPQAIQLGFSAGTLAGGLIDAAHQRPQQVGRLSDLRVTTSQYGSAIPWVWGRWRLGSQLVWWSDLRETSRKKGSKATGTRQQVFSYSVDVMLMLCRGPITAIRKVYGEDLVLWDSTGGGSNESQLISVGTNTSGLFKINFRGYQTATLAYNSAAGLVQSTLEALTSIGPGNISVTGSAGGPWTATFQGALSGQNVPRMDMDEFTLAGGTGEGITTLLQGGTPYDITFRYGTATQSVISDMDDQQLAKSGEHVSAYRGRACVYINDLDLTPWGNRLPNFSFEVENAAGVSLAYDDFNRPDGNAGISSSGHTWQWFTVQPQIDSNSGESTSSPNNPAYIECGESDVEVQLTQVFQGSPITGSGFIVFRLLDDNNYLSFGDRQGFGPGFYELLKKQAGSHTNLATASVAAAHGDVIKVIANSTSIKCYVNNALVIDTTSTFNQTETKHGWSAEADAQVDDWSASTVSDGTTTLATILADIFSECGLTANQYDVSAATDIVNGFAISDRSEARGVIEGLMSVYFADLVEYDGKIVFVKRGGASVVTVDALDLGAEVVEPGSDLEPKPTVLTRRLQEFELPFSVDFAFISSQNGYQQSSQRALRYTKAHLQEQITLSAPLVFAENDARLVAERLLYQAWVERETIEISLPLSYLWLTPGDVITLPVGSSSFRCRIAEMTLGLPGAIALRLVLDDAAVLTQVVPGGAVNGPVSFTTPVTNTALIAWNGNAGRDADADSIGLYVAANGATAGVWEGAVLYTSLDNGASYQENTTLADAATFGTTTSVLAAGTTTGVFDDTNTVDITLTAGIDVPPVSMSDADVLGGANGAFVGDEMIRYGTVTSLGGDSYRLAHLLRGQRGTDTFWDEHRIGERVALDNGGITRVNLTGSIGGGAPMLLKAVASGQTLADVSPVTAYVFGRELFAWSPVNVAGARDGSNNLTITFYRRARKNNDLQPYQDVPLDFALERYETKILPGAGTNISAITQAAQATVTAAGHGLVAGDSAYFTGIAGMTSLNGQTLTVVSVSGTSFVIDRDTRGYQPYTSGGTVRKPLRSISTTSPSVSYSAANQTTDFGSPQPSISIALYQLNDAGARGYPFIGNV